MTDSMIRDNYDRGKVGDFLKEHLKADCKVDIVSAYFTIYAYHHLRERLDGIDSMRFLFGEPTFIKDVDPAQKKYRSYRINFNLPDEQMRMLPREQLSQKKMAKECYDWLKEKVEIRSMVKPNFLHGKMYHIKHKSGTEEAIVGSSNFTAGGLGASGRHNIELNMIVNDKRDIVDLGQWFESIWNGSPDIIQDVKEDVLRYVSKLYAENSPEFIYHKTLFHIFDEFLGSQSGGDITVSRNLSDSQIWASLFDFQKDGVKGALNRINKNGGCIIADSVGLGKTYEALAVIKEFESKNKRVLVVCPKKLSANWTLFQASKNHVYNPFPEDKFQYNVLYHTDMGRASGMSGADQLDFASINWGAYDLVVVDESHNFKGNPAYKQDDYGNRKLNRPAWLMEEIIKKGADTKVLLLSATPVNTCLKDLRNQISLITHDDDNALCGSVGIADIAQLLKVAQKHFTEWADVKSNPDRKLKGLLEKLDSGFFKLLDELTIARSREHVMKTYSEEKMGKFPEKQKPESFSPDIDKLNRFPSYEEIDRQISNYKLSIFNPSQYLKPDPAILQKYAEAEKSEVEAFTQKDRERFLIGMMKMNFLKRLESSINSFGITLDRTIRKIDDVQKKIRDYQKIHAEDTDIEIDIELSEDEQDEECENANWQVGKKLKFDLKDLQLDEWYASLDKDRQALSQLYNIAVAVNAGRDAKLDVLKNRILQKQANPLNAGNKKALVFTAFSDTAAYLYDSLKDFAKDNRLHIALVTGTKTETTYGINKFEHILTNFSPLSKNRPDTGGEIDLLIATDCISEGQNLQDCDTVINYDIHWNPIRIIQRFGRIDRLKSQNDKIQLVNFWPTNDFDRYIKLRSRVEARMALGDLAATGDNDLFDNPDMRIGAEEGELKFREKQLLRLKDEALNIEELDDSVTLTAFTLEDFRMELMAYIEGNRATLENAPLGMYAVVPDAVNSTHREFNEIEKDVIKPGVIFCLKQNNHSGAGEKINPVAPYFLVYIRDDGSVRYNYASVKQILDIYRALCGGIGKPYQQLCDMFNDETDNGENMGDYAKLLERTIHQIIASYRKQTTAKLGAGGSRDAILPPIQTQLFDDKNFELVTWLVIKKQEATENG